MHGTTFWEVRWPNPVEGRRKSIFFEKKYDAEDVFYEAQCEIWGSPDLYHLENLALYRIKSDAVARRALVVAILNGDDPFQERKLVDHWIQTQGCPNVDNEKLLREYLDGDHLDSLAARYGIARSTIYDRLMRARKKAGIDGKERLQASAYAEHDNR